jgi:hypothetical protein
MKLIQPQKFVDTISTTAFGATAPSQQVSDKAFPTGDLLLYELYLNINHVVTIGTGSGFVTDGELKLIDAVYVETDKHGVIVDGVDGLGLHRIQQFSQGARPQTTALADSSATYPTSLRIPFADSRAFRQYDTALDMFRSRMTVRINYTDLGKGYGTVGTATDAPTCDIAAHVCYGPNPKKYSEDPAGELPEYVPYFGLKKEAISSTTTSYRIALPYGSLIYKRIYISQRNSSTYAELSTVVTATQNISLDVNGFPYVDRVNLRQLQGVNKSTYGLETMPTGWAVLDFSSKTGRIANAIDTIGANGNLFLVVDVTSVTNGALWIYTEGLKRIPSGAER